MTGKSPRIGTGIGTGISIGVLALVTTAGALTIAAGPAAATAAATRYVATTGSDGSGNTINDCTVKAEPCLTVQHAVDEASAGDTVSILDKGPYHETVRIRKSLTVVGQGSTGAGRTVIDGNHDGGASIIVDGVDVEGTVAVTLKDLAVDGNPDSDGIDVDGDATLDMIDSSSSNNHGVGLASDGTAATVTGSTISGNAILGVVNPAGTLQLSDSVVDGNGTIGSPAAFLGAGVAVIGGSATIARSTVDGNSVVGVYVFATGALRAVARASETFTPNVTAAISDTTVSHNGEVGVAVGPGAATTIGDSTLAGNGGAGIYAQQSSTVVQNSTISGTSALTGKAGLLGGQAGVVYLSSAPGPTVRRATVGGGLFAAAGSKQLAGLTQRPAKVAIEVTAGVDLTGTIDAENSSLPDCSGDVIDSGNNLSSDAANSCKFTVAQHDQVKTDPLLGPLADNGGPTKTEILKKHSPAIDAIAAGQANCTSGSADQRGVDRPQPTGGKCDVGAVELAAQPLAIHPDTLPNGTVGKTYAAQITATGGQYPVYAFALAGGALPDGLSMDEHGAISGKPTKAGTFHFTVSVNDPVLKDYTIVIAAPAAPNGNGKEPIAATGVPVLSVAAVGAGALFAGFLMLVGAGLIGRRPGRHRVRG